MRTKAHGQAAVDADPGVIVGAFAGRKLPLQIAKLRAQADQGLGQQQGSGSDIDDAHTLPQMLISRSIMSLTTDITRALAA